MGQNNPVIRASEISQYAFCARAWWLGRVRGYRSSNLAAMRRGEARHRVHGRAVESYHRLRWFAVGLLALSAILIVAWLLLSLVS